MSKWNVYKDTKSPSYIIDFTYQDERGARRRYRKSAGRGVTKKDAERQAAQLFRLHDRDPRAFVETFARAPTTRMYVRVVAARWISEHVEVRLRASTRRTHEQILRVHLEPWFGDREVGTVTVADVAGYVAAKRAAGLSPKSVNNHLSVLSSILDHAVLLGHASANVTRDVDPLPIHDQGYEWLDRAESERFLRAVQDRDPALYGVFLTALRTGLRQGELCALRWMDVDLDRSQIVVKHSAFDGVLGPTKGGRTRRVPLPGDLVAYLASRRHADPAAFVFLDARGDPFTRNTLKNAHMRAAKAIGRPALTYHGLRHSYASQLVAAGAPLNAVKELLGHTDFKTTLRYAHVAPDHLDRLVQVLATQPMGLVGSVA